MMKGVRCQWRVSSFSLFFSSSLLLHSQTSINLTQFLFKFKHQQQNPDPHHHQSQYNFSILFYYIASSPPSFLFHFSKLIIINLSGIFTLCYSPSPINPLHAHTLTIHSFSRPHLLNDTHNTTTSTTPPSSSCAAVSMNHCAVEACSPALTSATQSTISGH